MAAGKSESNPKFTEQELAKYKEIFNHLDQDNDGKITHADLKKALNDAGWGLSDEEVKTLIGRADKDGSGFVTWDEFLKVAEGRPIRRRIEAALRRMFRAMDTDGSGSITASDLRKLLDECGASDQMTDAEIKDIIKKADKSGDGKISFEEFVAYFLER